MREAISTNFTSSLAYVPAAACSVSCAPRTWIIFLSEQPARKKFCLSGSGLNLTQYGMRLLVKTEMHLPTRR